jgi:hypothetical protein
MSGSIHLRPRSVFNMSEKQHAYTTTLLIAAAFFFGVVLGSKLGALVTIKAYGTTHEKVLR